MVFSEWFCAVNWLSEKLMNSGYNVWADANQVHDRQMLTDYLLSFRFLFFSIVCWKLENPVVE